MHGAWVNFMTAGKPEYPGLPMWPAYSPERRTTMELNVGSHLVDDPDGDERCLWDGVRVD
jgi:para-nitrobenzyl esterase